MRALTEAIDTYLTEARTISGSRVTAYHVGRQLKGDKFDLSYSGSGEGMLALGPGVYFSTTKEGAMVYEKYARDPWLYEVEIATRGLYQHTDAKPSRLKDSLLKLRDKLLPRHGVERNGELQLPSASRLHDGPWIIGNIFKVLGAREGRRALIKAGIKGVYEPLPGGQYEIAVYDTSIITFKERTRLNGPNDYSDKKVRSSAKRFGYETSSQKQYGMRSFTEAISKGLRSVRKGGVLSLYFQDERDTMFAGVDYTVDFDPGFSREGGRGIGYAGQSWPMAGDPYFADLGSAVADSFQDHEGKEATVTMVVDGKSEFESVFLKAKDAWMDDEPDEKGYLLAVKEAKKHRSSPAGEVTE